MSCDMLSIACVIIVMCSGPKVKKIVDLSQVNRFTEPPLTGPFCDLLWSDPLLEHVLGYKLSDQEFAEVSGLSSRLPDIISSCTCHTTYSCDFCTKKNTLCT